MVVPTGRYTSADKTKMIYDDRYNNINHVHITASTCYGTSIATTAVIMTIALAPSLQLHPAPWPRFPRPFVPRIQKRAQESVSASAGKVSHCQGTG